MASSEVATLRTVKTHKMISMLPVSKYIYKIPTINENAQSFHHTANLNKREQEQPQQNISTTGK